MIDMGEQYFKGVLAGYLEANFTSGHITVNGPVNTLTDSLIQVYVFVKDNPGLNTKQIAELLKRPYFTVKKQVSALQKRNLIEHRGSDKTGGYFAKNNK